MQTERIYWLAWSQLPGIGPVLLKRLQQHFANLETAWNAPIQDLGVIEGFGLRLLEKITSERPKIKPEQFFHFHCQKNPHFWTPADREYPGLLQEIPNPPPVLYYRGQKQCLEGQSIAIVGTRYPTEYGKRWTRKITIALAKHNFTIISGMALGIDTEAHRSCLEVGGKTIAVLGTGLDVVYPASNERLYQEIAEKGLIVTEYVANTSPSSGNFPARNRIVAGLSRAVLIMEAPTKSGALITARLANDFGKDVYVLPGSLDSQASWGCLALIDKGAQVILSEEQLLESLGTMPKLAGESQEDSFWMPNLSSELVAVYKKVDFEPTSFDSIVQNTNLTASAVSAALLQLELMELIAQLPGMRYQRIKSGRSQINL